MVHYHLTDKTLTWAQVREKLRCCACAVLQCHLVGQMANSHWIFVAFSSQSDSTEVHCCNPRNMAQYLVIMWKWSCYNVILGPVLFFSNVAAMHLWFQLHLVNHEDIYWIHNPRTHTSHTLTLILSCSGVWHSGGSQREISHRRLLCESDITGAGFPQLRPVPALLRE